MKRIQILVVFILFIFVVYETLLASKTHLTSFIYSRYKGISYQSAVSEDECEKITSWDPIANENVPLSPEKAIQAARIELETFIPKNERSNWRLVDVEMNYFNGDLGPLKSYEVTGKGYWYYVIHFANRHNEFNAVYDPKVIEANEDFRIVVMMNGVCCKPVLQERPKTKTESSNPPKLPEKNK